MSNVTMKSTKQEIMDALKEAQAELKKRQSIITDDVSARQVEAAQKAIDDAARDVESGVFSDELNEKYENLNAALAEMQSRLNDMYGIEEALQNLMTVTNAAKALHIQMDEESAKRQRDAEEEKRAIREEIVGMRNAAADAMEEAKQKAAAEHEREEEEYRYELSRKRKVEQDEYDDKMAQANKRLDEVRAEAAAIAADTEAHAAEIAEMRQTIEDMPKRLEEERAAGYAEGEKAAGKDYGYKKTMAEKEHEYEIKERDNMIARLENDVDQKNIKIEALEEKLDAAYAQIRELAAKTVESNGSIKVINGSGDSSKR